MRYKAARLLLLGLFIAPSAKALNPCTTQTMTQGYLIYVDSVTLASANVDQRVFSDRLRFAVESNLKDLQLRMLSDRARQPDLPEVFVILCDEKRRPRQKSDFTTSEVQWLDQCRVVLELWALVLDPANGHGQLGYALIPASTQRIADPAVYTLERGLGSTQEMVLKTLSKTPELGAYATIAVGIRLFQNHKLLSAAGYLCRGAVKLKMATTGRRAQADPLFVAEQKTLLDGTINLRNQALRQLGADLQSDACPLQVTP